MAYNKLLVVDTKAIVVNGNNDTTDDDLSYLLCSQLQLDLNYSYR
jgi:hypothetical protein